ncbi:MAG: hypothetical protein WA799_08940 [Nitrosotalea sp.]
MKKILYLTITLAFIIGITLGHSTNVIAQQTSIPSWVKNTALWWGQGQISDSEFIKAIQWMITDGLIQIPSAPPTSTTSQSTPTIHIEYVQINSVGIQSTTTSTPQTGENIKVYNETSDAAANVDYQEFSTYYTTEQHLIPLPYQPENTNAQCSIFNQVTPEKNNISIIETYISSVCIDGRYMFVLGSSGTNSDLETQMKDTINSIADQIPPS